MKLGNFSFSLNKLRQRDITLIIIVLTALVAALWFFYMYKPTQNRIAALNTQIEDLNTQIRQGEVARDNLPQLREQLSEANAEKAAFLRELPTESEVANLITTLRDSANTSGVVLESIGQGRSESSDIADVRPMGFSLSTTGNYSETMSFLNTLETLERFTKVQQIGLSRADDVNNPDLKANFDFTVYVFTGQAPEGTQ